MKAMQQAPAWLPFRVRSWIDQQRILKALDGLDRTRPRAAASPDEAQAEVHMLMCARDVKLGVMALKSLLRFGEMKLALTLSHDHSVTDEQKQYINHHVPNARWLEWPCSLPATERALADKPHLAELYEAGRFEMIVKLCHPIIEARCARVIQMDSDTCFFRPPGKVMAFVQGRDGQPLYLHDHQDEATIITPQTHALFERLAKELGHEGQPWQVAYRFFNAGLLVYRPDQMDLGVADRFLGWLKSTSEADRQGQPGIWLGDWVREQTCYHLMYALTPGGASALGDDYHLGGEAGHVFNHFLRHYLVRSSTLAMIRQVVNEL
jgi:hypothetical protein